MFDGFARVGAAWFELHVVDGGLHLNLIVISQQFKVCVNLAFVGLYPHLNAVFINVQIIRDVTDKMLQFPEVVFPTLHEESSKNTTSDFPRQAKIQFVNLDSLFKNWYFIQQMPLIKIPWS